MARINASIIGENVTSSSVSATGIWSLMEHRTKVLGSIWPGEFVPGIVITQVFTSTTVQTPTLL